eukprot:TRINITY_DN11600_c0_g1_i2.p2 TRINITY_DN11600_c0_g1~~TRINITY_DN11600_c0_g1_i2.p2  ORF type:complete len:281 (+),score=23.54 TRINITY_DN11600_c0_g1_i2:68-910(+)
MPPPSGHRCSGPAFRGAPRGVLPHTAPRVAHPLAQQVLRRTPQPATRFGALPAVPSRPLGSPARGRRRAPAVLVLSAGTPRAGAPAVPQVCAADAAVLPQKSPRSAPRSPLSPCRVDTAAEAGWGSVTLPLTGGGDRAAVADPYRRHSSPQAGQPQCPTPCWHSRESTADPGVRDFFHDVAATPRASLAGSCPPARPVPRGGASRRASAPFAAASASDELGWYATVPQSGVMQLRCDSFSSAPFGMQAESVCCTTVRGLPSPACALRPEEADPCADLFDP